ncbi:MAG: hypothetical protein ACRD3V_23545 [Vicinamibacteria bacterium]
MSSRRIAVLGAGPIGLETALAFAARGNGNEVQVYERDTVGGNLKRFGHIRLFSPWEMNHSPLGARWLEDAGVELPEQGAYLTAGEHADRYLSPLAQSAPLAGRIHENTEVLFVGREGIGKNDMVGGPRHRHPFRLLLHGSSRGEEIARADVVVDCTGTYGNSNWLGSGNLPAKGERGLSGRIDYELRDVCGGEKARFEGSRVLLVGGGHSAATALDGLLSLSGTTVEWVARKRAPLEVIASDPLPERKRLSELANRIAGGESPRVRFYPEAAVESLQEKGAGFEVELSQPAGRTILEVDRILAHVGYHPENRIYRELQVHECYASSAPMKLAAALLGASAKDCLAQSSMGAETLLNPEPDFFILGAKSYGKNSNFLIRVGLEQIEDLVSLVEARPS